MGVIQMRKASRPRKEAAPEMDFNIDSWIPITTSTKNTKIMPHEASIILSGKDKDSGLSTYANIRLGAKLAKKLQWEAGDPVCFFQNPKDLLEYAAVKRGGGYKVIKEVNGDNMNVRFKFDNRFKFMKQSVAKILDFIIHQSGYMVFRIEGETNHKIEME